MTATEAFPPLSTNSVNPTSLGANPRHGQPRVRRRSSRLGGEIRAGDTSAPALATLDINPLSPSAVKAQHELDKRKPFSKRRKAKTLFQQWKRYALKHTWVSPLFILATFLSLYGVNPTASNPIHHFLFLSYKLPLEPGQRRPVYGKGLWDIAFVFFHVIFLSFTREFIMQKFLRPLSRKCGLKNRAKQSRFMEQMYTAIYFGIVGPWGLYVMSRTPVWYFNTHGMFEGFPHKTHDASFKFYYLFQASYWAQQAIVLILGMEKPRKDFKELVGHHIVSLSLIALSYRFHFAYMGLGVFITHDISDFFLATSKTLNYLDHPLVGPYFGFFILTWIYCRHYLNLRILWSEFNEFQTVGPYVLDWKSGQFKCPLAHYISTALLTSLQSLNLFWLYHIFRIGYRFLFENIAEDDRSDNEDKELDDKNNPEVVITKGDEKNITPSLLINGETEKIKYSGSEKQLIGTCCQ